ncbi:Protein of unknown function [Marinactinospora thermotolerans DSM 45154]|uniref:TNT domain-containing protein n=1 Tax=Marinactinospora thermotolerans DSM 45154 TaxID=1122192 RepID=A0A1T4R3C8_9ACTN|nr:TNT domain-containing protein [Marinactinospora thermotolerans]SKA10357.1 Protein of unknown function [Marinactinospora thermotolerans DSM 45154]
MARDYDSQLLESVAVRRQRLREAVLFGPQRDRRGLDENITKIIVGLCVAAVLCGGTVGWSFVQDRLATQEREAEQVAGPPGDAIAPVPADWVGTQVTLSMLREELDRAGVPRDLYVLPGDPRPPAAHVTSYYLLSQDEDGYSIGVVEFERGRTGAEFASMDEAARWLYQQVATTESAPERLSAEEEDQAARQSAELAAEVRERLSSGTGDSYAHTLRTGQIVDAFGQESGSLLYPDGLPFAERGLPEQVRTVPEEAGDGGTEGTYHRYRVVYPFQVTASLSPGAGSGDGGGVRFSVDATGFSRQPELPSIRWLLGNGYLERVAVTEVPE